MNESDRMRRRTRWFMVGALAVAAIAFTVIAASGINKNLVYYWTPTDLHANGEKAYGATIRTTRWSVAITITSRTSPIATFTNCFLRYAVGSPSVRSSRAEVADQTSRLPSTILVYRVGLGLRAHDARVHFHR